jgi:hypothetical protein
MNLDLHKDFASLGGNGPLSAALAHNALSGSVLAQVAHVKATLVATDGSKPMVVMSDADVQPGTTGAAELPLSITSDQLVEYLTEGPVDIQFSVVGDIPTGPVTLTHTLEVRMTSAVDESATKL